MDYPLYLQERRIGTLRVSSDGGDTCFEVDCFTPQRQICRIYAQGERRRLLLGVLEGGDIRLKRQFSQHLTAPMGRMICARAEMSNTGRDSWRAVRSDEMPRLHLPEGTLIANRSSLQLLALPYDETQPFPLVELFCFAEIREIRGDCYAIIAVNDRGEPCITENNMKK